MIDHVASVVSPEMITVAIVAGGCAILIAMRYPAFVFALGFPTFLFAGQLQTIAPISVSGCIAVAFASAGISIWLRGKLAKLAPLEYCILLLACIMGTSLAYTRSEVYGGEKFVLVVFTVIPMLLLLPRIIRDRQGLHIVARVMATSLWCYFLVSAILAFRGEWTNRFVSLHDEIVSAQSLGAFFAHLVSLIASARDSGRKLLYGAAAAACLVLIALTGTRAVIIASVLTLSFCLWFYNVSWRVVMRSVRSVYLWVILLCIGSAIVAYAVQEWADPAVYAERLSGSKLLYVDSLEEPQARIWHWLVAWYAIQDSPIFGVGIGGYREEFLRLSGPLIWLAYDPRIPVYPHNLFLEIASEQGLIGAAAFVLAAILSAKKLTILRRQFKSGHIHWVAGFTACLTFYGLCVAQTSLDLPRMTFLWWGLGMLYSAEKVYRETMPAEEK